jgi:hypothetical protein
MEPNISQTSENLIPVLLYNKLSHDKRNKEREKKKNYRKRKQKKYADDKDEEDSSEFYYFNPGIEDNERDRDYVVDEDDDSHSSSAEEREPIFNLDLPSSPNINLTYNNAAGRVNLEINLKNVFLPYNLNSGELNGATKMFPYTETTRKIAEMLDISKSSFDLNKEISDLMNNKLYSLLKNINNNQSPLNYESKNNFAREFPLFEKSFDYALYILHSRKNKATNNSVTNFNQDLFEALLDENPEWNLFRIKYKRNYYCLCDGKYNFYSENQHYCKHNNKIDAKHFIGVAPVLDMITAILSNNENYDDIKANNEKGRNGFRNETMSKDEIIFDISDGFILKLARHFGFYMLADICISLICWTDKFELNDGSSICVVLASINELNSERRSKEQNIIPLAAWICYFPLLHSIFEPVVEMLNSLFYDKNKLTIHQYSIKNETLHHETIDVHSKEL